MGRRKIRDEADARACLGAAKRSGLTLAGWGRTAGVDGRSLHAWSMNLARGGSALRGKRTTRPAAAKHVELIELVAAPTPGARTMVRYVVRVGRVGVEIGDDFDAATLRRLVAVLAACIGAIYGKEEKAKRLGLTGEALRAHRRQHIAPLAAEFCAWMEIVEPTLLPSDPLAGAIRYYKNQKAALQRFIDDPDIPIDNSPTEREFQNVAKLRLNALFAGSTEGAHRACVLLGIVATCRALSISALRYMTWAFERLGTHRDPLRSRCRRRHACGVRRRSAVRGRSAPSRPVMTPRLEPRIPALLIGHFANTRSVRRDRHARASRAA